MADVVIAGGGAAGLLAGISATRSGGGAIILERMAQPGKKLMITGKGRCNITNTCPLDGFIENIPGNGRFLYSALSSFTNEDMIALLEENGCKTKAERGGRVFPDGLRAKDVVDVLVKIFKDAGGRIVTGAKVTDLLIEDGAVRGVRYRRVKDTGRKEGLDYRRASQQKETLGPEIELATDAVVVACGGASYPGTGSDGNMVRAIERTGHKIVPLLPALVPLEAEEGFTEDFEGQHLKNIRASIVAGGKTQCSEFGEMEFIRHTIAGPVILTMSKKAARLFAAGEKDVELEIDFKPSLNEEKLTARIGRDLDERAEQPLCQAARGLLFEPFLTPVLDAAYLDADKKAKDVTKKEREQLLHALKHFSIPLKGTRPLAEAIVTSGGVDLSRIDPSTMQSKIVKGLYFAGEVMDVDGYTGGFNLQSAFSSGWVAGSHAAQRSR